MVHELANPAAFFAEVRALLSEVGRILVVEPPVHVTTAAFESTLDLCQAAGFEVVARPKVSFSKAAVLKPFG
jgi:hypothetical protein